MGISKSLEQVLEDQLAAIAGMEDGTEEKSRATQEFKTMHEAYVYRVKTCCDLEYQEAQLRQDKIDKAIGHVVNGAKAVGTVALVVGLTAIGYKFEETGAQTSQTFKKFQDWIWKFAKM